MNIATYIDVFICICLESQINSENPDDLTVPKALQINLLFYGNKYILYMCVCIIPVQPIILGLFSFDFRWILGSLDYSFW